MLMEKYFRYLYGMLEDGEYWPEGYRTVAKILFEIPFRSTIPNDDNRAIDGLSLREKYGRPIEDICEECTMLEMLIALCERMQWELLGDLNNNSIGYWFSVIMNNLEIEEGCNDEEYITMTILNARDRQYDRFGHGGFFPLKWARKDQRRVELWYQMQDFLMQNY